MAWERRFFSSTRGRIVTLLRTGDRTVDDLSQALDLTSNAVRAHLATLERDNLVRQHGVRRGSGKPANAYQLTPQAEQLFPKAYEPVLRHLLRVLADRLGPAKLEEVLREAGHSLAAGRTASGDLRARVEQAAALLTDLGGLAEVEGQNGGFLIRAYSCPVAAVVPEHPALCSMAEALLSDVIRATVRKRCSKGEPARCSFEVAAVS